MPLTLSFAHGPDCGLTTNQHSRDVGIEHLSPIHQFTISDSTGKVYSCRVYHNVKMTRRFCSIHDKGLQFVRVSQVKSSSCHHTAVLLDCLSRLLQTFGITSSNEHMTPFACQEPGNPSSNT